MSLGTRRGRRSWIWFLGWREWLPDSWQPVSTDENDGIEICEDESGPRPGRIDGFADHSEEKQPFVNEDEPPMNTNRHED